MIPENEASVQSLLPISKPILSWTEQLQHMLTSVAQLQHYLALNQPPAALDTALDIQFPVRVTRFFADLMQPGNWHDPLLRQVLPWASELELTPGYTADPLAEKNASPTPGLIHKYARRVLVLPTSACAIHCRYCFRRHFPYQDHRLNRTDKKALLGYLQKQPNINEVILSGGDPLMLQDNQLAQWVQELAAIPQISRVRIHSRLPIVLPDRLTDALLQALTHSRLKVVMVLHANHPQEISARLHDQLKPWRHSPVTLLNQSVLLAGVNNEATLLAALSEALFSAGILPYYLHVLDRVQGAAHFQVDDATAQQIHLDLQRQCPGFLVPKLVREEANALGKTWLNVRSP